MEIHHYLPPALLEGISFDTLGLAEFLGWIARARYLQEVEAAVIQRGIADAFPAELD